MGAGSPEHPQGDAHVNEQGIVSGHAYSILRVEEVDGNKLIQLRNPHGSKGLEWSGDWSDEDNFSWNERILKQLNVQFQRDGCFWMCVEDFIDEKNFKNFYVCRIFDPTIWTKYELKGKWDEATAGGFPNPQNTAAKLEKNPQYGLKASKKTTVFIELTQPEGDGMFKGKVPLHFFVQKNESCIVQKIVPDQIVGSSGKAIALMTVSAEVILQSTTYPYTFSLLANSFYSDSRGHSDFHMNIYSDSKLEIVPLKRGK
eukprot:TRINITY_DN6396_c0_g1_i2.p1 TRINITY_DN6396_c0_g1~~TRINITY_DN6396_c0_g1_i2.p1  ORF type:complete len:257 (-),score=63.04 TRINITY_DN6396_c0_g1_i2:90-860(-)